MTITFQDGELRQVLREHVQSTQPELLAPSQDQILLYPEWLGTGFKRDIGLPSGIDSPCTIAEGVSGGAAVWGVGSGWVDR